MPNKKKGAIAAAGMLRAGIDGPGGQHLDIRFRLGRARSILDAGSEIMVVNAIATGEICLECIAAWTVGEDSIPSSIADTLRIPGGVAARGNDRLTLAVCHGLPTTAWGVASGLSVSGEAAP